MSVEQIINENTELFTEKSLTFEDGLLNTAVIPLPEYIELNPDTKFGILKLNAITAPLSKENIEIIFMVDRSGSMSDVCSDGRSKMQHICHTLTNMVLYFKDKSEINVHITIRAFDDEIYNILDRCQITSANIYDVLCKINKLTPKNSTNIEMALQDITATAAAIRDVNPKCEIVSIFMTDGEVSAGKTEVGVLSELVDKSITNYFIGFGIDHDAVLLNTMGNCPINSSYHFIDKIENAGYVYGEILHGIVYKMLFDVTIEVNNGLIYDYKNNLWTNSLEIGNIVSEAQKVYHIISTGKDKSCYTLVKCNKKIYDTQTGEEAIMGLGFSIFDENERVPSLQINVFRQRTMQLLYMVNQFNHKRSKELDDGHWGIRHGNRNNEEEDRLKAKMEDFIEEMKQYMDDNGLENDKMMKNMCDDIYISLRTFGSKYGAMYSCARQTSQGTQRCYTVNHTPETINLYGSNRGNRITRLTNQNCFTSNFDENLSANRSIFSFDALQDGAASSDDTSSDDNLEADEDVANDVISHHQVSQVEDSPFMSPSAAQMMREISGNRSTCKEKKE